MQTEYTSRALKTLMLCALFLTLNYTPVQAQEPLFSKPSWWFGAAFGENFNFYRGSTQQLSDALTPPVAFHNGYGAGLYLAPLMEFRPASSHWGLMLQAGYDNRKGTFNQQTTVCNCPADLDVNLSYITLEPSLRFAPFKSNFYLYGGPRVAFNLHKSYTYKLGINPAFPEQRVSPVEKGDLNYTRHSLVSMQIGAGYDIPLISQNRQTQASLSPFISFQPYFGQSPRSIETWNLTTLRVGAALKFGRGKLIPAPAEIVPYDDPKVSFYVTSPKNIPVERRVRETFPLRNYVFFDLGSTEIPERYKLLRKSEVVDFKEDQLEVFAPKTLSGRSGREMVVYYNILNILGDRMGKNPSSTVLLVGSSEKGPEDGEAMAFSIKKYLVQVFWIDGDRIRTEGRDKPKIPSEQPGGTRELELLREGDRRVSIESTAPALLMEFQSGPDAPLKPVEINAVQDAPLDSYITFDAIGAIEAFTSWSLEIRDEKGKMQYFGPFYGEKVRMPGKFILGSRPEGDFKVMMVGQTKTGKTVKQEKTAHMVLWTPAQNEQGMRFSILYEFNDSKAIAMYEKYLSEIVVPKIPLGSTAIIHGYTDIIGDVSSNQKLSLARANDVKNILENALTRSGRKDVKFEVFGFGEDEVLSPFENKFPEERFYNRTVIIDIIPNK